MSPGGPAQRRPVACLHIGLHKTGSTALQRYLDTHASELRACGVLYPEAYRALDRPAQRHDHRHLAALLRGQRNEHPPGLDFGPLIDCLQPGMATLWSSENLWHIEAEEQLQPLMALRGRADVLVLAVLRDPVPHLKSLWKERLKSGHAGSLAAHVARETASLGSPASYYAYRDRLLMWGRLGRVLALDYDVSARRGPGGLVADVGQALGQAWVPALPPRANESMSDLQALLLMTANTLHAGEAGAPMRKRLKQAILQPGGPPDFGGRGQAVASVQVETAAFIDRFHAANPGLGRDFGVAADTWTARPLSEAAHPHAQAIVQEMARAIEAGSC